MPAVIIEHEFATCIGCGACESTCPDVWQLKEHNGELKAFLKKKNIPAEEFQRNKETAEACPVQAIHLIDAETGKKII